ncbi:MAG: hypothetical protein WEC75_05145 [Dehalococcoidia bacterium]
MSAIDVLNDVRERLRERVRTLPGGGEASAGYRRLRALLQEMGVRCDDAAELQDADAVLLVSARGIDALVAARLDDEARRRSYSRVVARLLVGEMHAPIDAKIEYLAKHTTISRQEAEEDALVATFGRAVADGRLDTAPRPLYQDVPKLRFAFTPRSAARSTLGGFHLWSGFWYRRSNMYRRWRSRRDVSTAIGRICTALG